MEVLGTAGQIIIALVSMVFTAGGIYQAIKHDLQRAHEKALDAKAVATRAHDRIDIHLEKGH